MMQNVTTFNTWSQFTIHDFATEFQTRTTRQGCSIAFRPCLIVPSNYECIHCIAPKFDMADGIIIIIIIIIIIYCN